MGFRYACFISYCHGQYELVKGFVDQLKAALNSELDPLLDEQIYIDEERLKPGYRYNEALARAICESACMVVVYSPKYERHEYCVREFEGMEKLVSKRLALLGSAADRAKGFIIPVVLRGDDDLPAKISRNIHYANFSKFTLASPDMIRNPFYIGEIQRIARLIYDISVTFREAAADPCTMCSDFELPPIAQLPAWRPTFVNR